MNTLLKNEFKESSRNYLIVLFGAIGGLLAVSIMTILDHYRIYGILTDLFAIAMVITFIVITIAYISAIIGDFKSDFFTDKAYLKFSLPVGTKTYLGAKIINTLVWQIILALGIGLAIVTSVFLTSRIVGLSLEIPQITLPQGSMKFILYGALTGITEIVSSLILLYFSIVLTKAIFKNSKNGNVWFFIFLGLSIGFNILSMGISSFFPDIEPYIHTADGFMVYFNTHIGPAVLLYNLYNIVLGVLMFFGASYLIENKIDF